MVFPQFSDFPQAEVLDMQALPSSLQTPGAVLLKDAADEAFLASLVARCGSSLLLPECWQHRFPQVGVLISSAISGGTFRQRLEDALQIAPERCWLLLEPISMEFSLPCTAGTGHNIPVPPSDAAFYSNSLCCYYTHTSKPNLGCFTLFDTEETLREKIFLARELGFCGFVAL